MKQDDTSDDCRARVQTASSPELHEDAHEEAIWDDETRDQRGSAAAEERQMRADSQESTQESRDPLSRQIAQSYGKASKRGRAFVEEQQRVAAAKCNDLSHAARRAVEKLHAEKDDMLADIVEKFAAGMECSARYLGNHNTDELVADAGEFARRRPVLTYGGLFLAGLAVSRFLKSSQARHMDHQARNKPEPQPQSTYSGPTQRESKSWL